MIKEHGISPTEAWKLDIVDIYCIEDKQIEQKQDTSMMLNARRLANGIKPEDLKNKVTQ